ncbi:MAG: YihY/virulence factor BrkB family protein [Armatimonadota bacterium]|nr:YihY/virulence factor BrkB family protein [Armatimonadota bacterium]
MGGRVWIATVVTFARCLVTHEVPLLAAAIAYTAVLSFFPLLVGVVALLARWVEEPRAQQAVVEALRPYLPPGAVSLVWGTLDAAIRARGAASVVATVVLFWTATAAASTIRHSLNRVLGAARPRPFWRRKVIEFGLVTLAGGLISLSLIASAALAALGAVPALADAVRALRVSPMATTLARVSPWVLSVAAFAVVYAWLPNVRLAWRTLAVGTLTAAALFEATKQAFFWYLRVLADYPLVYSHLAGVVVLMIWIYLAAFVLLMGAEVMRQLEDRRQVTADVG